ncbi:hypothetical protein [Methyloglobulus sp.]|uniref:hypothetical protein n=1 Tax=Methyloglobulus sp. TaxID=2518622 RepID=UPI0032B78753
MAVFTATGTGGKYIGSVQFQTWFNGKEDTNPYGIGNCSWGMLQPGQSIVCVGETELVSSGNGMVAGFHLVPGGQSNAVVGRKF